MAVGKGCREHAVTVLAPAESGIATRTALPACHSTGSLPARLAKSWPIDPASADFRVLPVTGVPLTVLRVEPPAATAVTGSGADGPGSTNGPAHAVAPAPCDYPTDHTSPRVAAMAWSMRGAAPGRSITWIRSIVIRPWVSMRWTVALRACRCTWPVAPVKSVAADSGRATPSLCVL